MNQKLLKELREVEGVKNVKQRSDTLKINLFSRPIPGGETKEIRGDLRSISQRIGNILDNLRSRNDIERWEWIQKPEKKYLENSVTENVSDRKPKGYNRTYYTVAVEK